jgi:23S rRNA (cytidine1920-2'-O)/16S rRNA (cytidine1409-2'-O)-methyltransferase
MGQFLYRVKGDRTAARPWFDKAIARKDNQIDTLYFLSRYDLEAGDRKAALEKLEKALEVFSIDVRDRVCLDIGSSTGGFTDCMLQNGAAHVYAIDVGRGQLDWKLRNDPRVTCMEKTNIRYVLPEDLPESGSFASIDVSFISLMKVLIPVRDLLVEDGEIVCLIKPQFEAGREQVGKHGVVREPGVQEEVIRRILYYAPTISLYPVSLAYSPIKGPEGNIEFLCRLLKKPDGRSTPVAEERILQVVREAHESL